MNLDDPIAVRDAVVALEARGVKGRDAQAAALGMKYRTMMRRLQAADATRGDEYASYRLALPWVLPRGKNANKHTWTLYLRELSRVIDNLPPLNSYYHRNAAFNWAGALLRSRLDVRYDAIDGYVTFDADITSDALDAWHLNMVYMLAVTAHRKSESEDRK